MKPTLTIVHADGRYKVLKDGKQMRVPMSTGNTMPVEFEHRAAAEGYIRVYRSITRQKKSCPAS